LVDDVVSLAQEVLMKVVRLSIVHAESGLLQLLLDLMMQSGRSRNSKCCDAPNAESSRP